MRRHVLVPLLAAAALLLASALPAAAQSGAATARLIHGIPDLVVDVYGNGQLAVSGFRFATLSDPLTPQPGTLRVDMLPAGATAGSQALLRGEVDVPSGADLTVAAHLTEGGEPTITRFLNDAGGLPPGEGRLTVRHLADAPEVDVRVEGGPVLAGVGNAGEASAQVPAGALEITIALTGEEDPLVEPVEVDVPAGSQTVVYPVGSAEEGTLDILVQTVSGEAAAPSGVPSGDGGAAAPAGMPPALAAAAGLAAVGGLLAARRPAPARR